MFYEFYKFCKPYKFHEDIFSRIHTRRSADATGHRHIYDFLRSRGYDVLSWYVVDPVSDEKEAKMSEQEIYRRDINLLKESGCLIAEVTVPSIGVGYEICRALEAGLPVLCVHDTDANVSAMLLGNPNRGIQVQEYGDMKSLERILCEFVETPDEGKD